MTGPLPLRTCKAYHVIEVQHHGIQERRNSWHLALCDDLVQSRDCWLPGHLALLPVHMPSFGVLLEPVACSNAVADAACRQGKSV